jgi:cell division initiation protein
MLTPTDFDNVRFSKKINGYNVDEVDEFLDSVTVDYEKLYRENAELKDKFEEMEKDLEHYKSIEKSLQNTLVMAQTTAADIKDAATKQAEQIVRDAQANSKQAVDDLTKQEIETTRKIEEMKRNFEVYKAKMEALLISQLEMLQDDRKLDENK